MPESLFQTSGAHHAGSSGIVENVDGGSELGQQQPSAAFVTDEQRWAAVTARDAAADGVFYYSVRTTGA